MTDQEITQRLFAVGCNAGSYEMAIARAVLVPIMAENNRLIEENGLFESTLGSRNSNIEQFSNENRRLMLECNELTLAANIGLSCLEGLKDERQYLVENAKEALRKALKVKP